MAQSKKGDFIMKKIIFVLLVAMVLFASCGGKGLKAGTYEAENALADSTVTVKVTVDNNGKITDVYFDETYKGSTKKTLGYDYNMKAYGGTPYEWFEQIEFLEKAIVENQGTDFITLDANGKTDAVSGCTIGITNLVDTFNKAIAK